MTFPETRRAFLSTAVRCASAGCFWICRPARALQHTPQPLPSPNAPRNPNVPGGMETLPSEGPVKAPALTINAALITDLVQQLYTMAGELKQETERTNLRSTLPVDFIRRAQQIEKLAKSIRQRASG